MPNGRWWHCGLTLMRCRWRTKRTSPTAPRCRVSAMRAATTCTPPSCSARACSWPARPPRACCPGGSGWSSSPPRRGTAARSTCSRRAASPRSAGSSRCPAAPARPHLTTDLVYALGKIITEVPAALSRRVDPRSSLSLVWGRVAAGTVANAIPDAGVVEGTVRCLDDEAWHSAPDLLKELIDSVAAAYGLHAEFSYQRYVPPTVNDQASTAMISAAALGVLGPGSVVQSPQSLGGEDFAWYLESIPGALARLGTRVPGSTTSLDIHQPTFDIDERAIGVGVRVMAATAITALWDDGAIVAQPLPGVTGA